MFNQHRTRTRAIQGVIDIPTSGALKYPSLIVSEDTRLNSMMKWNFEIWNIKWIGLRK